MMVPPMEPWICYVQRGNDITPAPPFAGLWLGEHPDTPVRVEKGDDGVYRVIIPEEHFPF